VKPLPDQSSLRFLPSVLDRPDEGFRYMKRRRKDRRDRSGDPLSGVAALFPIGLAFAFAFVLAAFLGLGIQDLLAADAFTVVVDPGGENMQVIVKRDGKIEKFDVTPGDEVQGVGTLLGSFYRLADGTIVWVPAGQIVPEDATPIPDGTYPEPAETPYPGETAFPDGTFPEPTETLYPPSTQEVSPTDPYDDPAQGVTPRPEPPKKGQGGS
jgi:hypothetical protein